MDELVPLVAILAIFVGMPWLILHYTTRWKTAATLTNDDEALLEELYQLARRLEDRLNTVERIVAADNPEFKPARLVHDSEAHDRQLRELDDMLDQKGRIAK